MQQTVNLGNIKYFAQKRKMTLSDVAEKVGVTYVGLAKIIRENTTTLSTLVKIATVLNVPVQIFFSSDAEVDAMEGYSYEKFTALLKENAELKKELNDLKDKFIRLADRF